MQVHANNNWLSCYLYYEGAADTFLTNDVWPFVRQTIEKGQVKAFFFIRYSDSRGPHIRLRLKSDEATPRAELKALVASHFRSVRFARYVPEVRRYGGRKGVEVAEQLFEASSTAALRCISGAAHWNYNQAPGNALQSHLGMVTRFGMGRREAASLFEHIAEDYYRDDNTKADLLADHLDEQSARTLPQIRALWDACEKNAEFNVTWFSHWRDKARTARDRLRKLYATDQLEIPQVASHGSNQLWYLYESYIHMTNNRFGLTRQDEALVAYIIKEALKDHE